MATDAVSSNEQRPAGLPAQLRMLAQGRSMLDVAQLQFVDLASIEKAYGDRWPAAKNRIADRAETFLRRRIDSQDILVRADQGFLVVFGNASGEEARRAMTDLTEALNAFFVGSGPDEPLPQIAGELASLSVGDVASALIAIDIVDEPALPPPPPPTPTLPDISWRFEPVWDVQREALSLWQAAAYHQATGLRIPGYQFENDARHPSQFVKLDEAGLWVAENALKHLHAMQKRALIGSAVHIGTLTNLDARTRLLDTIDRLEPGLHRYRLVKIAGVAPGFPRMYLREVLGALRARLPNIVILAAWDEPDLAGLLQSGDASVGIAIPPSSLKSGPATAAHTLIVKVAQAARIAHTNRTRIFLEGAITKFLAMKFAASGVDYLSSPSIWPARVEAPGMLKWPADRLAAA